MLCLRCGLEDDNALGSCPLCDRVDGTASMPASNGVPIARVPLVRMRAAEVFAEAVAMLGQREIVEDESNVTARLASADDDIPTIAAPDDLPLETARGAALVESADVVDAPEGNAVVEDPPPPIPEREEPLFAIEPPLPPPRRRAPARRRPRGGILMMAASCIGMLFAGTAIGSMQFGPDMPATPAIAAATARAVETPAAVVPVEVAQVVESLPPIARPPLPKKKPAPSKKKAPVAKASAKKTRARR